MIKNSFNNLWSELIVCIWIFLGDIKEDKKDTFTEKLVTQIIKNLQVTIKDIHLRYEDNFSDPRNPFSLGFTLHNLIFKTTDEKWVPAVIQESINVIHKVRIKFIVILFWNFLKINSSVVLLTKICLVH